MSEELKKQATKLMNTQSFNEAIPILHKAIEGNPSDWGYYYMVGQCYRFINDLDNALTYHKKAVTLKPDEPSVLLALGIVHQLKNNFTQAIDAFHRAIAIDPDYELAYNSLALTQKKYGELEMSLDSYDAGAKALFRRITNNLWNDYSNKIFKHCNVDHQLWVEYAIYGAEHLCINNNKNEMAFTFGEQALEEERTEKHGGLYWVDYMNSGKSTRLFLPNYFNTFREILSQDRTYSGLIGNRGTVLELLGRHNEANQHIEEARYFSP